MMKVNSSISERNYELNPSFLFFQQRWCRCSSVHFTTLYLAKSKTTVVWMWELQHYGHKSIMTAGSVMHGLNFVTESFQKNKCVQ